MRDSVLPPGNLLLFQEEDVTVPHAVGGGKAGEATTYDYEVEEGVGGVWSIRHDDSPSGLGGGILLQLPQHAMGGEDGGLQTAADGVIAAIVDAARGLLDLLGDFQPAHAPRADGVGPMLYGGLHDLARYSGKAEMSSSVRTSRASPSDICWSSLEALSPV